jgi:hypothetical protein
MNLITTIALSLVSATALAQSPHEIFAGEIDMHRELAQQFSWGPLNREDVEKDVQTFRRTSGVRVQSEILGSIQENFAFKAVPYHIYGWKFKREQPKLIWPSDKTYPSGYTEYSFSDKLTFHASGALLAAHASGMTPYQVKSLAITARDAEGYVTYQMADMDLHAFEFTTTRSGNLKVRARPAVALQIRQILSTRKAEQVDLNIYTVSGRIFRATLSPEDRAYFLRESIFWRAALWASRCSAQLSVSR